MTIKVRPINAKPRRCRRRQHSRRGGDGDGEWAGGSLTRNWPFRVSNEASTSIDRVSISLDRRALLIIHRKHSSCCCIMHYKFEGSNSCCCALLGQLLLLPQDMQVCVAATVHRVNNYMTGVPLFGAHTALAEEVYKKLEWFFLVWIEENIERYFCWLVMPTSLYNWFATFSGNFRIILISENLCASLQSCGTAKSSSAQALKALLYYIIIIFECILFHFASAPFLSLS